MKIGGIVATLGMLGFLLHPTGVQAASAPNRSQVRGVMERTIAEEGGFNSMCAASLLDLDGDGSQEAVFTFAAGSHGSQARAIQWKRGKSVVLFAGGSSTPNTDFVRVRGVPTIVLERSDYEPDYVAGKRTQQLYPWNGITFAHAPTDDCLLEDRSVTGQDGSSLLEASDAHCQPSREPIPTVGCAEF